MIGAYSKHEDGKEAIGLFRQMEQTEVQPNSVTFICILSACAMPAALGEGRNVHTCILKRGLESDVPVGNALVSMYGKCKAVEEARVCFQKMQQHDVVSWNALISAYSQDGHGKEAFDLFTLMQQERVKPDKLTFVNLLAACASPGNLMKGRYIHDCISNGEYRADFVLDNSLLNMYGKCGALEDAREIFDNMLKRSVVSWTTMITAYTQHGSGSTALQFYHEMKQQGVQPNKITFISILGACDNCLALLDGKLIHASIVNAKIESDMFIGSALINMYSKCGALDEAWWVFDNMVQRNVVTWNSMISACSQHGHYCKALSLFQEMQQEGLKPNGVTYTSILNACTTLAVLQDGKAIHASITMTGFGSHDAVASALIHMYGKCNKLEDARSVFDNMQEHDVVAWSAIISAYADQGHGKKAFELFQEMQQQGVEADKVTYICILGACSIPDALEEGKAIQAHIVNAGYDSNVKIGNALINMYSKCGALENASSVFNRLDQHDVVSWNTIISACTQHGHAEEALQLFEKMLQRGVQPNQVTFLGLLTACSHAGLVEKARHFFVAMTEKHGISPTLEHYSCVVDLLGRAGQLVDAKNIIDKMSLEPDAHLWTTLLNACRLHGDVEGGEFAAGRLFELGPGNVSAYVTLSNLYASTGRWNDVERVREAMIARGVEKLPGCSWIEIGNKVSSSL